MRSRRRFRAFAAFAAAALVLSACTASRAPSVASTSMPEVVSVEGSVTVRGNEPFAAYVLETPDRNFYVLRFSGVTAPDTPMNLLVTGRLYLADWEGRPYAHIEVESFERL